MWKTEEGSTGRLVQLCIGYFVLYVIYGVASKYFEPLMGKIEFAVYTTSAGTLVCLSVSLSLGWYRIQNSQPMKLAGRTIPSELLYIIPSGLCTAVVIPTTTLMYSLKGVSVMVAMVIMRGAVIVISRLVDALQIKLGILKKRVYWEENVGVVFALLAVAVTIFFAQGEADKVPFYRSPEAMLILTAYLVAYAIRIYIMNYYKNTRPPGTKLDNQGFFGTEQISASFALMVGAILLYTSPTWLGTDSAGVREFVGAFQAPKAAWPGAAVAGGVFGVVAFFSVFIFMFKGRTATFAGLVNRLTSLVAGTVATLIAWAALDRRAPKLEDWASLGLVLVAVYFLTRSEKRRAAELSAAR
jgi:uncharacterized membrane protein YdcZ (DUF606 family)